MQNSERVAEVLAVVGERHRIARGEMEPHVAELREPRAGDIERRLGRIDAMEQAHSRRDLERPAARTATEIETFGRGGQLVEWENAEIGLECFLIPSAGEAALIERRPLFAEPADRFSIEVAADRSASV